MMLRTTCVISFYYGNSHTHCGKSSAPSFRGCEETRRFYTETLLYIDAFTHRSFYTQSTFTHRCIHTETLLHAQKLLHTEAFTHGNHNTQTLLHTYCFTMLLNTEAFTRRRLLHTEAPLHTDAFMQDHIHRRKMSRVLLSRHHSIPLRLQPNDSFVEDAVECRSHRLVQ